MRIINTTVKVISGIFILLLSGGWVAYKLRVNSNITHAEIQAELKPVYYTAGGAVVREMDFSGAFEYRGTVEAGKIITLSAESEGKILYSAMRKGISVPKGLLLVKIDGPVREANYQVSQDNYNKAKSDYDKLSALLASGNATGQEVENAQLQMQNAASQVNINKTLVDQTSVVAPDTGVIVDRKISQGEYVQVGSPLGTLVCLNEVFVNVYIPENRVSQIKAGSLVTVKADAYPGIGYPGAVTAVIPVASAAQTFPVEIKLANFKKEKLMAGMNVSVVFAGDQRSKALVIPRTALVAAGKQTAVYLIGHSLKPILTPVVIGHEYGTFLEVLNGLQSGDTVMTSGQSNVEPGFSLQHLQLGQ